MLLEHAHVRIERQRDLVDRLGLPTLYGAEVGLIGSQNVSCRKELCVEIARREPEAPAPPSQEESNELLRSQLDAVGADARLNALVGAEHPLEISAALIDGMSRGLILRKILPADPPRQAFGVIEDDPFGRDIEFPCNNHGDGKPDREQNDNDVSSEFGRIRGSLTTSLIWMINQTITAYTAAT